MNDTIPEGTRVEIDDPSRDPANFEKATIVGWESTSDRFRYLVRYDNGCVVKVDEYRVRILPDPIRELHAEFTQAVADRASDNDIVQLLDDWFVKQGLPTVLYA